MKVYDVTALEALNPVSVSGHEVLCHCPYHEDTNPSATFNVKSGLFHCFACGAGKNVKQLSRDLGVDVVRREWFIVAGMLPTRRGGGTMEWHGLAASPLAYDHPYLESRGVSNAVVEEFGVRELAFGVGFPQYDREGHLTGFIVRKTKGFPRYLSFGTQQIVWPTMALPQRRVFIVEGVFGVLRAFRHGYIAHAMFGTGNAKRVGAYLQPWAAGVEIAAVLDPDYAGYVAAMELLVASDRRVGVVLPTFEADEGFAHEWRHAASAVLARNEFDVEQHVGEKDVHRFRKARQRLYKEVLNA